MKKHKPLRTTDIARAAGVHPNTVRVYEEWHLIPPVPRAPNGYRQFTQHHLNAMILARKAMTLTWLGGDIRKTAYEMVYAFADGNHDTALELARSLQATIQSEHERAESAIEVLNQWVESTTKNADTENNLKLSIGEAADHLAVTRDSLRNWERNGLIDIPRNPGTGYRIYGAPEIARLRVIRTLRQARYSMMAILRILRQLDSGNPHNLREALDTPEPHEQVYEAFYNTDRWLSTLTEIRQNLADILALLQSDSVRAGLSEV